MVRIINDGWDISLNPASGSIFKRCLYRGIEIFRTARLDENLTFPQLSSGHFPLLPFSNRIENGCFEFEGKAVNLPMNAPGQKHVLHGYGWVGNWTSTEQSPNRVDLEFTHTVNAWPWDYRAVQSVHIQENVLRLDLSVTNQSQSNMPCGLGFHPYFPDLKTASLSFESDGLWLPDEDCIPRRWVAITSEYDFGEPRNLKDLALDHCFTGVGTATIRWTDSRRKIDIRSSKNLNRAAVYIAQDEDCFCFEPISHTHNALNMENPERHGVKILTPGETQSAWCEFEVSI